MHHGGFGAGVAELVMCWIAGVDDVLPQDSKKAGTTLQVLRDLCFVFTARA